MKQDIKRRWIKALRSGNYMQAKSRLRNKNNEFCVMGVLADVLAEAGGKEWEPDQLWVWLMDGSAGDLTTKLREEVGLTNHQMWTLINDNDSLNLSFNDLANEIEAKY